jgi:copper chaperone
MQTGNSAQGAIRLQVPDMTCNHCVATITQAVRALDPGAQVEVDLPAKRVTVTSALPRDKLLAAISDAGYSPQPA